jgi:phenylacetate-CoA ligase
MFETGLFILAHQIGNFRFYPTYKKLIKNQWKTFSDLKKEQEAQLKRMIYYSYNEVPYYNKLFKNLSLKPQDIRNINDLEKLPILTKDTIKKNWEDFKPANLKKMEFYEQNTGGSTGMPFKYRLYKFDRFLNAALWYRGWGYAGYELGDRTIFMGGSSLGIDARSYFIKIFHERVRNIRMLSSFDMDEVNMKNYVQTINRFKPRYIYGYASSLYFFAKWIEDYAINIHSPNAIISTAEKLFPEMREKIESVFETDLYDTYGLNDGGVSAYECSEHAGLHIDMERSVMEVIDKDGHQLDEGEGRILATSLHNYAMPFIRYDTGDIGHIISENCRCDRGYRLLKNVTGRQQEMLLTPEGKYVHGEFFTHIFWEINGVKEFQVLQKTLNKIVIKIVPENDFDDKQLVQISEYIRKRSKGWDVEFNLINNIERSVAGKYKFVINELER